MARAKFRIWRGEKGGGEFREYSTEVNDGMVVLDAVHQIQAGDANDLAVRWNCKAGKCGSCSAEINGMPRLMCMTRMNQVPIDEPITIEPIKAFPHLRDLVTDVSWNYEVKKKIKPFKPRPPEADGTWRMDQKDVDRVMEFRKCIECFLCQDVCHVLRDHHLHDRFIGPRYMVYTAALEMHPLDTEDRLEELKDLGHGVGFRNITKCCTKVCPEEITITDNAIIPLKERVVDRSYDPVRKLLRILGEADRRVEHGSRPVEEVGMFELKPLSTEGIGAALAKAEQYRLLNEARFAESICLDVLEREPGNQRALVMLLLSRTDQFARNNGGARVDDARSLLPALTDEYERLYYAGLICERWAKGLLTMGSPGSGAMIYDWLRQAMDWYEKAEKIHPAGHDDPILRWNTCARMIMRHDHVRPDHEDDFIPLLE